LRILQDVHPSVAQLGKAAYSQFLQNVRSVLVDCFYADEERIGDLLALLPLDDQPDDLFLADGEILKRWQGLAVAVDEQVIVDDDLGQPGLMNISFFRAYPMPRKSSSGPEPLTTYAFAPCSKALKIRSFSSHTVSTITGTSGAERFMCLSTSMPEMSGNRRSRSTTSGLIPSRRT
jgi:hypothetical protein